MHHFDKWEHAAPPTGNDHERMTSVPPPRTKLRGNLRRRSPDGRLAIWEDRRRHPRGPRVSVWVRHGRASAINSRPTSSAFLPFPLLSSTRRAVPSPLFSLLAPHATPRSASSRLVSSEGGSARCEQRREGAGMRMLSKACSIVASSLPRCSSSAAPTVAPLSLSLPLPHRLVPFSRWFSAEGFGSGVGDFRRGASPVACKSATASVPTERVVSHDSPWLPALLRRCPPVYRFCSCSLHSS